MNLLQNFHLAVIDYLYLRHHVVPLQTFTTRHSNRKLSIRQLRRFLGSVRQYSDEVSAGRACTTEVTASLAKTGHFCEETKNKYTWNISFRFKSSEE